MSSFVALLTVALITLKLTGLIAISWWLVWTPMIVFVGVILAVSPLYAAAVAIQS